MARYWVPGSTSGSGVISQTDHWSDTDGGTNGFSAPTSADDVYFTSNSFSASGQVVTGNLICKSLTCSGVSNNPALNFGIYTYGNVDLSGTFTVAANKYIYVNDNCSLNSGGKTLGTISLEYKSGGYTFDFASNITLSATFGGSYPYTINTNNYNLTAASWVHGLDNSATINLGSSFITLTTAWGPKTNNLDAGTSTIKLLGLGNVSNTIYFSAGNGDIYYNVELYGKFTQLHTTNVTNVTYNNLKIRSGSNYVTQVKVFNTATVTTLDLLGTLNYPLDILNLSSGTNFTFSTSTNNTFEYTKLTRCTGSGTGSITNNHGLDGGNNNNITFTNLLSSGSGTSGDPYLIYTAYQLNNVRNYTGTKYFKQVANIDVSTDYPSWTPIANSSTFFTGYYNGQLYSISNLTNSLFNTITADVNKLSNIILLNININTSSDKIGGLCKQLTLSNLTTTVISNCAVTGSITGNNYVGSICGYMYLDSGADCSNIIDRISNSANITGNNGVGGFVGYIDGNIYGQYNTVRLTNSINTGIITGNQYVGGFVGAHACNPFAPVTTLKTLYLEKCINIGDIKAVSYGAGFLGYRYLSNGNKVKYLYSYNLCNVIERLSGTAVTFQRCGDITENTSYYWGLDTCVWRRVGYTDYVWPDGSGNYDRNISQTNAKKQATYTAFTFNSSYWGIVEDTTYPYLYMWPHAYPPSTGFKIYLGTKRVTKIYKGAVEITKAYLGTKTLK